MNRPRWGAAIFLAATLCPAAAAPSAREGSREARAVRGTKVGAIVGGVAGAALLVLFSDLGEGLCDAATCGQLSDVEWGE